MITKSLQAFLAGICILIPGFSKDVPSNKPSGSIVVEQLAVPRCPKHEAPNHCITVFIHGTRIFPKFYYQEVYYSPEGLTKVTDIDQSFHLQTIAKELAGVDPLRFDEDAFYAFGWNGRLNFNERKKAAKQLYDSLKELAKKYKDIYGVEPQYRVVGHSHGGNVALNLAAAANDSKDKLFRVKELILLACPCQTVTKNYAYDPVFEKVYSLSSKFDLLQVVDPQGLYKLGIETPLFSERYLNNHPRVRQARIKITGRYIFHLEFLMSKTFLSKLPIIMSAVDSWYKDSENSKKATDIIPTINIKFNGIQVVPALLSANGIK